MDRYLVDIQWLSLLLLEGTEFETLTVNKLMAPHYLPL
jgi:hypothetical protein